MSTFNNDQLAEALKALADATKAQAQENSAKERGREMAKAIHPNNERPPLISTKNPQGDKDHPRPVLRFDKVFVPYEAEPSDFTFEELELLNLLTQGQYPVERVDGSVIALDVRVKQNDITHRDEEIRLEHASAFNREHYRLMPGLAAMFRQMLGEKADHVLTMKERQALVDSEQLPVSVGE